MNLVIIGFSTIRSLANLCTSITGAPKILDNFPLDEIASRTPE